MHQINRRTFLSWSTTMLASLAVSGCGSPTTPKVTPTTAVTIVEPTATPEVVTTLNFTTGIETNTQDFRLRELILVEAIRRLGLKGKLTSYPYNHAIELVDQGKADGDMGRIYNFNEKGDHPNYLRVEEPFQDLSIVHKRHEALATQFAKVLREMKAEGLIKQYEEQADQTTK